MTTAARADRFIVASNPRVFIEQNGHGFIATADRSQRSSVERKPLA
jgi:hypothetical protein